MNRRPKTRISFSRLRKTLSLPSKQRLLSLVRRPKSAMYFVALCLFVVAMNYAIQRSAWLPLPQDMMPESDVQEEAPVRIQEVIHHEKQTQSPASKTARPKELRRGWDFFHPSWRETPDLNLVGSPKFHPDSWSVSENSLRRFVLDPSRRLEPEFQVTPDIQERVLFWMRIHTQYSSYMRVLHDRHNPSIIYGVADFTPLFRESEADGTAMYKVQRFEREILKELRAKLSEAAGLSKTDLLSPWERNELRSILSKAGSLGAAESSSLIGSIRSQTGQRDEFIMALSRSEELLPFIEATFRSYGLPIALGRIPFVESSFNARAYSKVGATGMWQFMPVTARQMIHPTNSALWSDPLLQTRAAARMLIIYRSMLPDWSTTVTAYNSGPGRLSRLVRKHHTKSIGKLLEVNDPTGLGFAGKNFYGQFLSANLAQAYRHEIFPLRKRDDDPRLAFERPRGFSRRFRTAR